MSMKLWRDYAFTVGHHTCKMDILREKEDSLVARAEGIYGKTVIYKFWRRSGMRATIRKYTRTNAARKEWQALQLLNERGICNVPRPIACLDLKAPLSSSYTECLIEEDMGICLDATECLNGHIRAGRENEVAHFETVIIQNTVALIKCGFLDPDHRLPNFIITPNDEICRLDFELATRVYIPSLFPKLYGEMIGTFIGSYIFAVQPNQFRVKLFTKRLQDELAASEKVLAQATITVNRMLAKQYKEIGLDSRFNPPWGSEEK
ncbi:MAG: hypothetical protein HRT89_20485 [Lentisphaeria bacterium]|nr:hypothetical protein [Lentisphaeria bacterium]NQZ70437.1 hypothetical protein [Lentisphaeria bacterium]